MSNDSTITLQYPIEKEEYFKLFFLSPMIRKLKYFVIVANILVVVILYFFFQFVSALRRKEEMVLFDLYLIIFCTISFFILCAYTLYKYKKIINKQGEESYEERYSGDCIFNLEYDKSIGEFLIKNRNQKLPADNQMKILKTERTLFVYWRKDMKEKMFMIPRYGDSDHVSKLNVILRDLQSRRKVKFKDISN
ncbi:hypothetical protein D5E69_22590 (plasmid) [Rossellomorea marisflavi]|uniref:hypothetical protein n=1 Tax=Rossellomorea marisflavi TaxID=189381 RepID=UPI001318243E|nr:hypothetical protein [Rossellomorea marisflavi]QHA38768.1 hypothetical protein D5E69_22590 [Rossellomorea marisflavi]